MALRNAFGALALESTLAAIRTWVEARTGAKTTANSVSVNIASDQTVPISDGGGSLTVDGPLTDGQLRAAAVAVTISNEVEIKNDAGNPIPVSGPLTDAQLRAAGLPLPVGAASDEALEVLRAMFRLLKPLGQVSGGGRNHLAVDATVSGTVVANQGGTWNINQITNSQMGGVWGFDHARALSRQAYNSSIRTRVS